MAEDGPPTGNSPPRKDCVSRRPAWASSFVDAVIEEHYEEEEEEKMRTHSSSLGNLSFKSIDEALEEEEGEKLLISPEIVSSPTAEITPARMSFASFGEMEELPPQRPRQDRSVSLMFEFVIVFNFIFLSL